MIAYNFLYAGDNFTNPTHWDNQGHGTRVSGHAAASHISDPFGTTVYNGMAPAAKIIAQDGGFVALDNCADLIGLGCPVTNFYLALIQAVKQGATIHNNSWGDRENYFPHNTYTEPCRELDLATWSNKEFLVICAAGNNGTANGAVASPSTAKNSLSVAAAQNGSAQENLASFSSRGFASDGRYKPDLTAIGSGVRASTSDNNITTLNCGTSSGNGTSYSSPQVAGLAALVRDYFAQGFYPSGERIISDAMPQVSAALVKAILINASVHIANATSYPPAKDQGWGRINLSKTLRFIHSAFDLYVVDHAPVFNETPAIPYRTYLKVVNTSYPIKVTLVWSDYPATAGASKHLINDLDLRVVNAEGNIYKGNVFSDFVSVSGGNYDRINNVEQIVYFPTATGIVEISVWAHAIPQPAQDFALVVTGNFEPLSSKTPDPVTLHISQVPNQVHISFPYTEAQRYILEFTDDNLNGTPIFSRFTNYIEGIGYYTSGSPGDTGTVSFADNFSPSTSGFWPMNNRRFYRVKVESLGP